MGEGREAFYIIFLSGFLELLGGLSCLFLNNNRCYGPGSPACSEQPWEIAFVPYIRLCWSGIKTSEQGGAPLCGPRKACVKICEWKWALQFLSFESFSCSLAEHSQNTRQVQKIFLREKRELK